MTDTTTLAPCPFCGGDANIRAVARDWWKLLIDHANECMLSGHFEDAIVPQEDADKAELAHRWNRRATLAKWGAPAPASGELVAEVMFDERKYIQYTIPLELLPVGAKFYTAQEARVPLDRIARDLLFDVKNRVNALVLLPSSERRESEIRIKQDIADFLAAPPAQEAQLNPDMPVQELRLHMGELTTDEALVARAAIRWANTYGITAAQKETS